MGLIQKIKSALGFGGSNGAGSGDVDVTVEREPSTAEEDAVKGTDTAGEGTATGAETEPAAGDESDGTDAETEPEALVEEAEPTDGDDAVTSTEAEEAEATAEPTDEPAGSDDDVTEIKGIGPAYAERLAGVGIETVGDLAAVEPADVATETDLSESRVSGWIERAREY